MLLIGNSLEKIDEIEEKSVQAIVTSPPYWGLRDYKADGQLGEELVPEEFVKTLPTLFNKSKRVLKDDGTLWLNIGDTYFGAIGGHWDGGNSITNDSTGVGTCYHNLNNPTNPQDTGNTDAVVGFSNVESIGFGNNHLIDFFFRCSNYSYTY